MKIHRYSLDFKTQKIEGVLLEEAGAYSLIQPWESLGDQKLEAYLSDLRGPCKLALTQRALELLKKEAEAKKQKISLVPREVPSSHLLIDSEAQIEKYLQEGVSTFKIKIGRDLEKDLALLKRIETKFALGPFKLRLDANLSFNVATADKFFSSLSEAFLCAIDFVEDPFAGTVKEWQDFAAKFNLRLAHDFAPAELREAADIWVLKPSRENPWPLVEKAAHDLRRIVVTSALDHPLGHVIAASEAQSIAKEHPLLIDDCGLISFESLGGVEFPLERKGAGLDLSRCSSFGFGMDAFLNQLKWEEL